MNNPRFTVGSVSGYSEGSPGDNSGRWATIWYVHDRAYGHKVVRDFRRHLNSEARARSLAAFLNKTVNRPAACEHCGETMTRRLVDLGLGLKWGWKTTCPGNHCIHGHEMTKANTYIHPGGKRAPVCRRCKIDSEWRYRHKDAA